MRCKPLTLVGVENSEFPGATGHDQLFAVRRKIQTANWLVERTELKRERTVKCILH